MARKRRKLDDDDDDDDAPKARKRPALDDDEDDDRPARVPSRNDAYTGLLVISTLAFLGAAMLFYFDYAEATAQPLTMPNVKVPAMIVNPTPPAGAAPAK